MRRRYVADRNLTAEQLVSLAESLPGYGTRGRTPMADQWHAAMREHGYDAVTYFRARYWLRRSKPAGYRWDA